MTDAVKRVPFAIKNGKYKLLKASYLSHLYEEFDLWNGYIKAKLRSGQTRVFKASAGWLRWADSSVKHGYIVLVNEGDK